MRFGNCWLYTIPKMIRDGGYILVTRSPRNRFVPHSMWIEDINDPNSEIHEFVPDTPKRGIMGFFHAFLFKGHIRKRTRRERTK